MNLIGDWMARVLVDTSKIGPTLSGTEKEWEKYYAFIEKKDAETYSYLAKSLKDIKNVQVSSREEAIAEYAKLNATEKKQINQRVKDFASANAAIIASDKKVTQAKTAEATEQIRQENRKIESLQRQQKLVSDLRLQILKYSTIAITVPITFMAKEALQEFMKFQQQMQNIKAVVGANNTEMQMLTQTAITMSEKFAASPIDVAKAMFDLGQAGLEANEIYQQIGPVMTLAAAGMKDVSFTAELVVTTLKAFNLSSEESSRVADVFASSNAKSVSSLDKLSASMKYTAGLWSSMGWNIEQLVGTLDTLYDTGVRGEKAGRLLASAINGLQRPTAGAKKAIVSLLGYESALSPAFNDITQIIQKMSAAHATTQDVVKIFGKESAEVINRLIQNYDKLDGNIQEVTGNIGEAARQAAIQMDSLKGKTTILANTFSNITKSFVSVLEPSIKGIVSGFTSLIKPMEKLPNFIKAVISAFTAFVAVAIPVSAAVLQIKTALLATYGTMAIAAAGIGAIVAPIALAGAGFAVLAGAIIASNKAQQDWIDTVDSGASALAKQGKSIDALVENVRKIDAMGVSYQGLKTQLYELAEAFPKLRQELDNNASTTASAMRVLNEEYAKYAKIEADRARTASDVGSANPLDAKILEQQATLSGLNAQYQSLVANTYQFNNAQKLLKSVGLGSLATDFNTLAKNVSDGTINIDDLQKKLGNPIGIGVFLTKIKELSGEILIARNALKFMNDVKFKPDVKGVETSIKLVEQISSLTEEMTNKVWSLRYDLQLANKQVTAKDVANAIGEVFDGAIRNLTLDNKVDMKSLGLMDDDGSFTQYYKDLIAKMGKDTSDGMAANGAKWAKVMMDTFDANVKDSTSFDTLKELLDGLSKYQSLKIDVGVETDPKKIADLNTQLSEMDKIFGGVAATSEKGLTANQLAVRRIVQAYLAWGVSMSENYGKATKGAKESTDWWGQLINKIEDGTTKITGGTDKAGNSVSSMTKRLKELKDRAGDSYNDVVKVAAELKSAFENDEDLKAISKFINLDTVLESVTNTAKLLRLEIAEANGAPVQVKKYETQLQIYTDQRAMLVQIQQSVAEGSQEWSIYEKAIKNVDKAILELKGNSGAISDFSFKSTSFSKSADERRKELEEVSAAYKNLSEQTVESIRYIVENIDPEAGLAAFDDAIKPHNILSAITAARQLADEEKRLAELTKENEQAHKDGTKTDKEYTEQSKKLDKATDELNVKKILNIEFQMESIESFLSSVDSAVDSLKSLSETLRDTNATATEQGDALGNVFVSLGSAVSTFNGVIGGVLSIFGLLIKGLSAIQDAVLYTSAIDITETTSQFESAINDAKLKAESSMQDALSNVGQSLGQYIADGFSEGLSLSQEDMAKEFATYMYNMISTALITASGFEDKIAEIADRLWAALSPGSSDAAKLQDQVENLLDTLGTTDTSGLQELVTAAQEAKDSFNSLLGNITTENLVILAQQTGEAGVAYAKALQNLSDKTGKTITGDDLTEMQRVIDKIAELKAKIATLDVGITNENGVTDSGALSELETATSEYSALLKELAAALGITSDSTKKAATAFEELQTTIESALTSAVLTGSYSDFKEAVYKEIVSSITEAVITASSVKPRIQALLNSIFTAGKDFTTTDADAVIAEIQAVWKNVTDDNTPLGYLLTSLRDSLSEFGLMDINVNPGTVVSAIPSDVRDDLIEAIQGTMDSLSQAIAEAGLNSTINTVNITTAYITAMQANSILITQANLNINGNTVFQMQTGQPIETWLENWMAKYLAKSGG